MKSVHLSINAVVSQWKWGFWRTTTPTFQERGEHSCNETYSFQLSVTELHLKSIFFPPSSLKLPLAFNFSSELQPLQPDETFLLFNKNINLKSEGGRFSSVDEPRDMTIIHIISSSVRSFLGA